MIGIHQRRHKERRHADRREEDRRREERRLRNRRRQPFLPSFEMEPDRRQGERRLTVHQHLDALENSLLSEEEKALFRRLFSEEQRC